MTEPVDCLIVGGGPAGLTAALYLARFRRRAVLVDAGVSRARWIPLSRNIPGFPEGVSGPDYLRLLRAQTERFGPEIVAGRIDRLTRRDGLFHALGDGVNVTSRTAILATGVADAIPDLPDVEKAIRRGRLRLCPVCDGYEATDQDIAVMGPFDKALAEGCFLTAFTDRVSVLGPPGRRASEDIVARARQAGLAIAAAPLDRIELGDRKVTAIGTDDERRVFDLAYIAMGTTPQAELAAFLGAACTQAGVTTDAHQRTDVPGLYAIGDVVDALNQIAVATGHAAIAAADVHNRLRAGGL